MICPGTVDTGMFEHLESFRVDKKALAERVRPVLLPADRCARAILRGVARNRAIITVTVHARLVWWLYRLAPRPFLAVTERAFAVARRKLRTD